MPADLQPTTKEPYRGQIRGGRLNRLEALRGLAALYVVAHHLVPSSASFGGVQIGLAFRFGQAAVILFFLLSGFVIHYSFVRSHDKRWGTYLVKRALRIYIPLVFAMAATYAAISAGSSNWIDPEWRLAVGNLLMLQDWSFAKPGVIVDAYLGNTPLWSLAYEWWFYMLYWPLWWCCADKSGHFADTGSLWHAIALGVAIAAGILYVFHPTFAVRIFMYFGIWWVGVMLAEAYLGGRLDDFSELFAPVMTLVLITSMLAASAWMQHDPNGRLLVGRHPWLEVRHFAFAIVAVVVGLVWRRYRWIGFNRLTAPGLLLAPISYALYIAHWPLLIQAEYLAFIENPIVEFLCYTVVLLVFCYIVERVIYPPLKRRLTPRLVSSSGDRNVAVTPSEGQ